QGELLRGRRLEEHQHDERRGALRAAQHEAVALRAIVVQLAAYFERRRIRPGRRGDVVLRRRDDPDQRREARQLEVPQRRDARLQRVELSQALQVGFSQATTLSTGIARFAQPAALIRRETGSTAAEAGARAAVVAREVFVELRQLGVRADRLLDAALRFLAGKRRRARRCAGEPREQAKERVSCPAHRSRPPCGDAAYPKAGGLPRGSRRGRRGYRSAGRGASRLSRAARGW